MMSCDDHLRNQKKKEEEEKRVKYKRAVTNAESSQ